MSYTFKISIETIILVFYFRYIYIYIFGILAPNSLLFSIGTYRNCFGTIIQAIEKLTKNDYRSVMLCRFLLFIIWLDIKQIECSLYQMSKCKISLVTSSISLKKKIK